MITALSHCLTCSEWVSQPCGYAICPLSNATPAPRFPNPDNASGIEGHPPEGTSGGGISGFIDPLRMDGSGTSHNSHIVN